LSTTGDSITETNNVSLYEMDNLGTLDRLKLINDQDRLVADAVRAELPNVATVVRNIVHSFRVGGRLIYVGAGTSGRLGVLDAAECPPTFGTDPSMVVAILAGGPPAMWAAVEGAEDNRELAITAINEVRIDNKDTVVGISASGKAPFVAAALERSRELGAYTAALTNNRPNALEKYCEITIAPIVGPEVIAGSTRLKSGTAQKLVLNMLSTNAMIEFGKTYGNLMVDVRATNAKLRDRALRITRQVTGSSEETATQALADCDGNAKRAILVIETGLSAEEVDLLLEKNHGFLRRALQQYDRRVRLD
jgi:N-acetylmuramic acid 6-phosphate etherase